MAHLFKKLSLMEFRQVLKSLSKRPSLVLESHQHNNCFFHILWNRFRKFQRSRSISTQTGGGSILSKFLLDFRGTDYCERVPPKTAIKVSLCLGRSRRRR